jgi:hypothetical protein
MYPAARPTEFPVVVSVRLQQRLPSGEPPSLDVLLELGHRSDPRRLLRLTFIGVIQLSLRQPPWSLFQIPLLTIRDVSADQLEGVRFKVTDEEDSALSFSCGDMEIELVESS